MRQMDTILHATFPINFMVWWLLHFDQNVSESRAQGSKEHDHSVNWDNDNALSEPIMT